MTKSNNKALRFAKKAIVSVLSLAMVASTVSVVGADKAQAAKGKVKSVTVSSPAYVSTLVLKKGQSKQIKVTVNATKKKAKVSQKVTFKTSNKKVAKVVKKGGKVYIKAVAKKGSAKITITSKANKKKKKVLKVKIGTPVKSLKYTKVKNTESTYNKDSRDTKNKSKTKKLSTKTGIVLETNPEETDAFSITNTAKLLGKKMTPKKATVKSVKWVVKNTKIAYVTLAGVVVPKKVGKTYLYAYAKDGSGKKFKVKVTVKDSTVTLPTATPKFEKSNLAVGYKVEDFESYAEGTKWGVDNKDADGNLTGNFTAGAFADPGSMTVVKDPENPNNKVLQIKYDGANQSYDFAPNFNVKLPSGTLDDYSAIRFKSRVICNTSDCNYKSAYVYFDSLGDMVPADYFATSNNDTSSATGVDHKYRFGVNISMATGEDQTYNVPTAQVPGYAIQDPDIIKTSPLLKYNNKVFPTYWDGYNKADGTNDYTQISPGYFDKEIADGGRAVGFQQSTLILEKSRIDAAAITTGTDKLLSRKEFTFGLGTTFQGRDGRDAKTNLTTMYLDDITFLTGTIPCTKMELNGPDKLTNNGAQAGFKVVYTPSSTTQKDVIWTSSDESLLKVDAQGNLKAVDDSANKFAKTGKVTITATNKDNPSVKVSTVVEIVKYVAPPGDFDLLKEAKIIGMIEGEGVKLKSEDVATISDGDNGYKKIHINYTKNNHSILLDLGRNYDLSGYLGVGIEGIVPGQMALELYDENLDMTMSKDDGAERDWYETMEGRAYPFFTASCAYRFEGGGFNVVKSAADPTIPKAKDKKGNDMETGPSREFRKFSLNALAKNCDGDWSSIRYIILKSNQTPVYPALWEKDNYDITKLVALAPKPGAKGKMKYYDWDAGNRWTINVTDAANQTKLDNGAMAYYVDTITDDNTLELHDQHRDFTDARYIKVRVKDTKNVELGLTKIGDDGKAEYIPLATETDDTGAERELYFSRASLANDMSDLDQLTVKVDDGGSVVSMFGVSGEISCMKDTNAELCPQYDIQAEGKKVKVTLDVYGSEE